MSVSVCLPGAMNRTVFTELSFITDPTDTVVSRDKPVTLDCVVQSTSPPSTTTAAAVDIQWTRDGAVITPNSRRSVWTNYLENIKGVLKI